MSRNTRSVWLRVLLLIGVLTLVGCRGKVIHAEGGQETTEAVWIENEETKESNQREETPVEPEATFAPTPTATVFDNYCFEAQADINLADIKTSPLSEIETKTIDLNPWDIQKEDVDSFNVIPNGSYIVFLLDYDSENARIMILEESIDGFWSLSHSEVFPGLSRTIMSPSGEMLALVYWNEQRIELFEIDQKKVVAETQVFSPHALVSWSEDGDKLISFVYYFDFGLYGEVAEVFSVPSLERIKLITKRDPENQRWQPDSFWWSPEIDNDKFLILTGGGGLLLWNAEDYEVLESTDMGLQQFLTEVSWINENDFLLSNSEYYEDFGKTTQITTSFNFYLFHGTAIVDEYRIIGKDNRYLRVSSMELNPETMQMSALMSNDSMVLFEIRDEYINSLCQVDIYSMPEFRSLKIYSLLSNTSIVGITEDNMLHIISGISCN
jgi:hypothetical protein